MNFPRRSCVRLLAVILLLLVQTLSSQGPPPEVRLKDQDGRPHSLEDYRGKIVVLNFWATWCIPCKEEMPMFKDLQKRYEDKLVVIGASVDQPDTQDKIPSFVRKLRITFPIWVGANTETMQKLGLGNAVPATAFLDSEGRLVGRVLGQLKKRDLFPRIEWMLGDHKGSEPQTLVNHLPGKD